MARNYLAHARVLARSFARQHPDCPFTILVVDDLAEQTETTGGFEILRLNQIGLEPEDLWQLPLIYDVTELSTAVKPWLLRTLLKRGDKPVLYFDPDIEVFAPLGEIGALARKHSIVLTPHVTEPMPRDGLRPAEADILATGVFNLGFLALGEGSEPFLAFWSDRLRRDCLIDPEHMLFTDQRWVDFVPAFYPHYILRDPTCDVAYWNLQCRQLVSSEAGYEVNGQPLTFFHFSGFDPDRPDVLSKHQGLAPRILLSEHADVAKLCREYAEKLRSEGFDQLKWQPYGFQSLASGLELTTGMRRLAREALLTSEAGEGEAPPDLFAAGGEAAFLRWLEEPASPQVPFISRKMLAVHGSSRDLQRRFPDPLTLDAESFAVWYDTNFPDEKRLLPPATPDRSRSFRFEHLAAALTETAGGEANRQLAVDSLESIRSVQRYLETSIRSLRAQLEQSKHDRWDLQAKRADAIARAKGVEGQLQAIQRSMLWKLVKPIWRLWHREKKAGRLAGKDLLFAVEAPAQWQGDRETAVVAGWCFSRSRTVVGVRLRAGRKGQMAHYGLERLDLARRFPHLPAARESGFRIEIHLPPGTTQIALDCIVQGEAWTQFFSQEITRTAAEVHRVGIEPTTQ